jgi:hypothetical protein
MAARSASRAVVLVALAAASLATSAAVSASPADLSPQAVGQFTGVNPARVLDTRIGIGGRLGALDAGQSVDVKVTGGAGLPESGVSAVVLNVTVVAPSAASYATVWPTGEPRPDASNLNFAAGQTVANAVIVKVGIGGRISLYNWGGSADLLVDVSGWYSTSSQLVPMNPARLLDTRTGRGGIVGPTAGAVDVQVTGQAGVPNVGANAVVVNLTVTNADRGGYVTVWPKGSGQPNASNVNFEAGATVANLAIVKLGAEGKIRYYNDAGRVDLLIDVLGYITAPTSLTESLDPVDGLGGFGERQALVGGQVRFNSLTAGSVDTSTPIWTEYNLGRQWGTLSSTFTFDDTYSHAGAQARLRILGDGAELANRVITFGQAVPVNVNVSGVLRVRFEVLAVGAISAYYATFADPRLSSAPNASPPADNDYTPLVPDRVLDTRSGLGAARGRISHQGTVEIPLLGRGGVPASGVGAVVLNVTTTDTTTGGYITAWPTGLPRPEASSLNVVANKTVANLVVVPVGPDGRVSLYNYGGFSNLVADVLGWFPGNATAQPASVFLTESLDPVDGLGGFGERQALVGGQVRFNSLTAGSVDTSTPIWTEYNLGRQWGTLSSTFTFDDTYSHAGAQARLRILGDGAELANRVITFGQAVPVNVNVSGVLRVRFEVLAVGAISAYYATFADPRLIR